jgi:hypothetical protein
MSEENIEINIEEKGMIQEADTEIIKQNQKYSIWEIEEFLKNNITPPGIETYDDMPPETPLTPSDSLTTKPKKPWETEENINKLNDLLNGSEMIIDSFIN